MATNNVFGPVNVYQINQKVRATGDSLRIAFPSEGVLIKDCTASTTTRSLASGVNVYGVIQTQDGTLWYCTETQTALIALANA